VKIIIKLEAMKEILNILLLLVLGIFYMVIIAKIIGNYLSTFGSVKNNAITVLYIAALAASGIILIDISKVITDAFIFFYEQKSVFKAIAFTLGYFLGAGVFYIGFFFLSFIITSRLTKENEKEAIKNNNVELALVHGALLIVISLLVGPALTSWAASFIPCPDLPF
jgi:uncharacterized membrane protein